MRANSRGLLDVWAASAVARADLASLAVEERCVELLAARLGGRQPHAVLDRAAREEARRVGEALEKRVARLLAGR